MFISAHKFVFYKRVIYLICVVLYLIKIGYPMKKDKKVRSGKLMRKWVMLYFRKNTEQNWFFTREKDSVSIWYYYVLVFLQKWKLWSHALLIKTRFTTPFVAFFFKFRRASIHARCSSQRPSPPLQWREWPLEKWWGWCGEFFYSIFSLYAIFSPPLITVDP